MDQTGSNAMGLPGSAPTIYDVARVAGVSIASVSRVLNGHRNPRPETKERVLAAVAELGFAPDGAARALSGQLREVVGVIVRRPWRLDEDEDEDLFADESESLQYPDLINRGIEAAAQRRGFDLLIRSVSITARDISGRTVALARKSDGLILHDRVLKPADLDRLSRQLPIVTLAGYATPTTANVHGDNRAGMQDLARHLLRDHGYASLAYLGGYADSPDSNERCEVLAEEAAQAGATLESGPEWQGYYFASGGARVISRLTRRGPRATPRDRVRERPDRARRHVRAARARRGRARPGRGDRLRRHPDGTPPGHQPDHRPPADYGDGNDGLRRAVLDAQPGGPARPRHRAAHRADAPGELRLRGPRQHPQVPAVRRGPVMRMIGRRIAFYTVTAVVAITVNFFIPRLMPGNPALAVIGRIQTSESKQAIAALEEQYGVQTRTGLWGQYLQYWGHLLHGNLGTSLNYYPASVGSLIKASLPWTIGLVGTATLISFVLGTLLGVAAAWRRGSWLDGLLPAMTFFQAAPYFFVAILFVALFATKLGWFPQNSGYATTTLDPGFDWPFISSVLQHAVLPAVTIVLASMAGWVIGMRNMMITTMDEDYVLLAEAKGLPTQRVISYAARNALLPSVAGLLPGHRVHRLGSAAHRDRLLLPRGRLPAVQRDRERRLPAAAGHLRHHHVRGPAGQPDRRLRLRVPRPADPAGGLRWRDCSGHRRSSSGSACPASSGSWPSSARWSPRTTRTPA